MHLYLYFNENFLKPCKMFINVCMYACVYKFHSETQVPLLLFYIYSYLYLCIYTPSYPHFKAFPVSKFNSETSFLYQLFKENSNIIVLKPDKLINEAIF